MPTKTLRGLVGLTAAAAITGLALVTTGAGTAAASSSLTLNYSCTFPLIGAQPVAVTINANVPSSTVVNQPTAQFAVTATVTVPSNATEGLNLVGAKTVAGTASAAATVTDSTDVINTSVPLTIPSTNVPASGSFNVTASGNAPSVTPTVVATATINVGAVTTTLTPLNAQGQPTSLGTFTSNCTLASGQNTQLASFSVVS